MKKALTISLLNLALASSIVFAQGRGTPPTAADLVQRRVTMLTERLSLTSAQAQQATTIFTASTTAAGALRESLKTAHDSLQEAIKVNDTASIDRIALAIGNLSAQQTATDAKADAAFYQILTPDQRTKLSESRGLGGRPGGFGPGPGGFGRGPALQNFSQRQ